MGKTPIATPIPEKHYEGPDGVMYPTGNKIEERAE
jgi:parafibromin